MQVTVESAFHFERAAHGRRKASPDPPRPTTVAAPGRIPRVSRLMAEHDPLKPAV